MDGVPDLEESLHAQGKRMTPQRRRVVAAVSRLGHATPESLATDLTSDGGSPLPLSTIYRNLEALEQIGVVSHTHLDHRSSTYHLAGHANHLHLLCTACGRVIETDVEAADTLVGNLRERHGFVADVKHMAIHGWCSSCAVLATAPELHAATEHHE